MSFFFCTLYQFLKCFGAPDCRPGRWWSFGGAPHHRSCEECVVTRSSEHHGKRCIELRTKTLTTITFSTIIRQMLSALKTLLFGKGSKVDPVEKPSPSSSSKKQIEQLPETTSRRMYQGNWSKKDTPLLMSSRRVTPVHSSQNHSSSVRRITPVHSVHSVRRITPVHSPTPSSRVCSLHDPDEEANEAIYLEPRSILTPRPTPIARSVLTTRSVPSPKSIPTPLPLEVKEDATSTAEIVQVRSSTKETSSVLIGRKSVPSIAKVPRPAKSTAVQRFKRRMSPGPEEILKFLRRAPAAAGVDGAVVPAVFGVRKSLFKEIMRR